MNAKTKENNNGLSVYARGSLDTMNVMALHWLIAEGHVSLGEKEKHIWQRLRSTKYGRLGNS